MENTNEVVDSKEIDELIKKGVRRLVTKHTLKMVAIYAVAIVVAVGIGYGAAKLNDGSSSPEIESTDEVVESVESVE